MPSFAEIRQSKGWATAVSESLAGVYLGRVRPRLPATGRAVYSGVRTPFVRRRGDGWLPASWRDHWWDHAGAYEAALLAGLRAHVRPGDRVVVVGGGAGVTAAAAALAAGPDGQVDCFEGSASQVPVVRQTAGANGVAGRVRVHHAVVGPPILVYGDDAPGPALAPADLPDCDVLELDCEGAEVEILRQLAIRPRVVLVETHGLYGAPTAVVSDLLRGLGYAVQDLGIAEPSLPDICTDGDVRVLAGTREANA